MLNIALTKFRMPRQRGAEIRRERLVARVAHSLLQQRLTLVTAPAGYGKTTLLSQVGRHIETDARVVWIGADDEDDEPHRLALTIVAALQALGLQWATDPGAIRAASDGVRSARMLLNLAVNALCGAPGQRVVIVIDDFHRVNDPSALAAIDHLLQLMPDHVGLVLASRHVPELAVARLRAQGCAGEFRLGDLQFSEGEARRYLVARLKIEPQHPLVDTIVGACNGWPAGLQLMSEAMPPFGNAGQRQPGGIGGTVGPHVFDFLAQEVMRALEPDLQRFVLQCAILSELTPALCNAVTGRTDAAAMLTCLHERDLFVSVVDEQPLALRFHDLFRDFLRTRLERLPGLELAELHARAAAAEQRPLRAAQHLLSARQWEQAVALIAAQGEEMLREGRVRTLQRLIAELPLAHRIGHPDIRYLLGSCAWARWDMIDAREHFDAAVVQFRQCGDAAGEARALTSLVPTLNTLGLFDASGRAIDELAQHRPELIEPSFFPAARLWLYLGRGHPERLAPLFDDLLARLRPAHGSAPRLGIFALLSGSLHCHFIGQPAATQFFERFNQLLAEHLQAHPNTVLHGTLDTLGAWAQFWRGELHDTGAALERAAASVDQAGRLRGQIIDLNHLKALYLAVQGDGAGAEAAVAAIAAEIAEAHGFREVWGSAYQHLRCRIHWLLGGERDFDASATAFLRATPQDEWPFLRGARALTAGQCALKAMRLDEAVAHLRLAAAELQDHPMPVFCGDPRLCLAYALLQGGDEAAAWTELQAALGDVAGECGMGVLLTERKAVVLALLQQFGARIARQAALEAIAGRYKLMLALPAALPHRQAQALSSRELQVLRLIAEGASNKRIAADLHLSLHTVKRHVANLIAKLDVASRNEAAAAFHRAPH